MAATNPSTGGSTNPPPNSSSPPAPTSIADLAKDLKDLSKNANVNLDPDTANEYLKEIDTFAQVLFTSGEKIRQLANLGDPGTLRSALITKANLNAAITGHDGVETLNYAYFLYLCQFADLVKKSTTAMIEHG